jgi:DNA-binding PadR family transcriptional regulator
MNLNKFLPLTETTFYVMMSLLEPAHGYAVMQKVEELSEGKVRIAAGTLYGAIDNLMKNKMIRSVESEDKRRKVYVITEQGREVLKLEAERIRHIVKVIEDAGL